MMIKQLLRILLVKGFLLRQIKCFCQMIPMFGVKKLSNLLTIKKIQLLVSFSLEFAIFLFLPGTANYVSRLEIILRVMQPQYSRWLQKPNTAKQWQVRQRVIAERRNEADTFGLIETDMDNQESSQREESLQDKEGS